MKCSPCLSIHLFVTLWQNVSIYNIFRLLQFSVDVFGAYSDVAMACYGMVTIHPMTFQCVFYCDCEKKKDESTKPKDEQICAFCVHETNDCRYITEYTKHRYWTWTMTSHLSHKKQTALTHHKAKEWKFEPIAIGTNKKRFFFFLHCRFFPTEKSYVWIRFPLCSPHIYWIETIQTQLDLSFTCFVQARLQSFCDAISVGLTAQIIRKWLYIRVNIL